MRGGSVEVAKILLSSLTCVQPLTMSSAHRPTWEPARAKADVAHISQVQSKYATPTHTHLKFRRPGDTKKRSLQELKAELEAGERRAFTERHPDAEMPEEKRPKLVTLEEDADDEDLKIPETNDEDDDDENDDEEEDDDEDDTEALLRELEKVKQERREQQERQEQSEQAQQQLSREEEIARGNPLLNLERALHGDKMPRSSEPLDVPHERWDDDLIFRNQAINADNGLSKRGFVNDLTRTYTCIFTLRYGISQKVYERTLHDD